MSPDMSTVRLDLDELDRSAGANRFIGTVNPHRAVWIADVIDAIRSGEIECRVSSLTGLYYAYVDDLKFTISASGTRGTVLEIKRASP